MRSDAQRGQLHPFWEAAWVMVRLKDAPDMTGAHSCLLAAGAAPLPEACVPITVAVSGQVELSGVTSRTGNKTFEIIRSKWWKMRQQSEEGRVVVAMPRALCW